MMIKILIIMAMICLLPNTVFAGEAIMSVQVEIIDGRKGAEGQNFLDNSGYDVNYYIWEDRCCSAIYIVEVSNPHPICKSLDEEGFIDRDFCSP